MYSQASTVPVNVVSIEEIMHDAGLRHVQQILLNRSLSARFQPILDFKTSTVHGFEGLIRGPSDSPFHSPLALLDVGKKFALSSEIEVMACEVIVQTYGRTKLNEKIFLNFSPETILLGDVHVGKKLDLLQSLGISAQDVVLEITEGSPTLDYKALLHAVEAYRAHGFQVAMDDLGEGFSSLRLWSELHPEYVKIDKHFVQGINLDPVKLQFVKSIQQIAENSGSKVIAEGIETHAELLTIKDLGIAYGQGYFIARPAPKPLKELTSTVLDALSNKVVSVFPTGKNTLSRSGNVSRLVKYVPPVSIHATNDEVFHLFEHDNALHSLAVVDEGMPVGMINRYEMIDRLARPYRRELYGKRPCTYFMDDRPLVVEKTTTVHELSDMLVNLESHHLSTGFIITDQGLYVGLGSGHSLLREVTEMQITAARYANPLTLLPGNVPINEHIDRLLQSGVNFWACYADLDNFKPFNDVYGFRKGDEVIQFTGRLLSEIIDPESDFLGHIGGDDFVILFQSQDWEERANEALTRFGAAMPNFYNEEDQARGGVETEDRQGQRMFHPFTSVSLGVVAITPELYATHHEVASAMAGAKKQAKKVIGNCLFLERRDGVELRPSVAN